MSRRESPRERTRGQFHVDIGGRRLMFKAQPGVFSQDGPDEGTMLLLEAALPAVKPHHVVLDLGAGIGIIGLAAAGLASRGEVWMVDSDVRAFRLMEENIRLNGIENAHAVLSDITLDLPRKRFDLVLSNPPTHSGKEVLASFVSESHDVLRPGGWLYLVVNRLLSVREMMTASFGDVEVVVRSKGFIVLRSQKARLRPGNR